MSVFGILLVILLLAFLVESLVEYFAGQLFAHVPALKPFAWLLMYIAALVGVLGAFVYRFDLLYLLAQFADVPLQSSSFGVVLTGLAIGRGANYIHDIVTRFFTKPQGPTA